MTLGSAERFRQVDELFDAALDLPPEERGAFVDRATADDAELRAAVHRLLAAHRDSADFLERPAAEFASVLLDEEAEPGATPPPPTRVGPYRLVREIGRGGMGAVFLAERDDGQFHQRVALKLIRGGLGAELLVGRFLEERRILATLEHPHIARLFDGGVTAEGLPFFAMEYVEGEPITTCSDARQLTVEGRLHLFLDVCEAMQYAHRNLVVHRDLKPSNILVTAEGEVKLLDFGIAKLLGTEGEEGLTGGGVHLLTPEYASPEQFRGERVTTASDVYALGVLLYELLTGCHPFREPGATRQELERRVLTYEPAPPSARAVRVAPGSAAAPPSAGDAATRAQLRGTTPARLHRRLAGDLDTIVLKAIRTEPERRYATVAHLAADLRRHLSGLPVEARPESRWYRARKFVGRHRGAVLATALALLTAPAFALREFQLRRRAEAATHEAVASARRAEVVQDFLVGIFDVADPFSITPLRGDTVSARTLLERGAARVDEELATEPGAQADLRGVLGRVYTNLGLFEQATPHLERSLEQRRSLYGAEHPRVAEALNDLGSLLLAQSRHDEAEPLLRDALGQRRRFLGTMHAATAESLDRLATVLQEKSDYDAALPLFQEALGIRRKLNGAVHPEVAISLNNLALILWWKGEYGEAEPLYREALVIRRSTLGETHPLTSQVEHNLAQVLQAMGRTEEAEAHFRAALTAKRKALGDAHPSVTINLNNLGRLLREKGELAEAESLIREALRLDRQMFGEEHPFVAASLDHLGAVLRAKGEFDEAEATFRRVLAMNRRLLGAEHARVAQALNNLGMVLYVRGDLERAAEHFREARALYLKLFGEEHPFPAIVGVSLARALAERGEVAEGEARFRDALDRLAPKQPAARENFIAAHVGLGRLLVGEGRAAEALELLERAERMSREQFGEGDWRIAEAELALGQALLALGRGAEGEPLVRRGYETLERAPVRLPRLLEQARQALAALEAGRRRSR